MCGIVAYIGPDQAYPKLIKGLKRLEYRGYDSTGVALLQNEAISVYKRKGKVADLENYTQGLKKEATIGIGHTRWATHGEPNDKNAHPHLSNNGQIVLAHNGIIENYELLKNALIKEGYTFQSDTDTEVLVNLIEAIKEKEQVDFPEAVRIALTRVVGAFAIVVMDITNPDIIVGARKASPLVVGIGKNSFYMASDATPIIEYTNKVIYLNDEEIAIINRNGSYQVKTIANEVQTPYIQELDMKIEMLEKGGYDYFMLKEIFEQPNTLKDSMRGRVNPNEGWVRLGGLEEFSTKLAHADRIIMVACGTSWHSCLIGEYLFEDLARIPVEVEYASEFRYRNPILTENDVVIAVSQSGETADTLAAIEIAKKKGAFVYGIVNVVGSSIARLTDTGSYIHAGPEIGVASTKAFTGQVTLLSLMALLLSQERSKISSNYYHLLAAELAAIPKKIEQILTQDKLIRYIAEEIKDSSNALYLGRGYNFPVALEGALKLKEISYIHAEGYPAAEMKHGPIALIDEEMPVIVIATNKSSYDKIVSNVQEVKARRGKVIAIVPQGDKTISAIADYTIEIPETEEPLSPLLSVIPLQLLSYHTAVLRGCNVDQPRNLAKSVTVE